MINLAKTLGVGIIGASAERGWAKLAHIPAIQHLAGMELVAVASGSQAKADSAARAFGTKTGYADGKDLIQDPRVDIVTVAVKVPDHRELVLAALAAGKHIYCEWPLGRNIGETQELAKAAQAAKVHVAIGLQTRLNPALLRARELIASGAIGRLLSARVLSTTVAFGPQVEAAMAFAEDAENGVTLVTIQGAHTIDFANALLGPWADLTALTTTQFPSIQVGEPPLQQIRSTQGMTPKVLWEVVKRAATAAGIDKLAPHDLRRTCARLCHLAGGELDQIQFLLGHVSIQTTEVYLGCKQKLRFAVNDRIGIEP